MAKHEHSVELTEVNLAGRDHVGAFFNTIDAEHRVLSSFYKDGIDRGEKAVLEALRRDEEFVRYRGKPSNQPCSPSVLLLMSGVKVSMAAAVAAVKKPRTILPASIRSNAARKRCCAERIRRPTSLRLVVGRPCGCSLSSGLHTSACT